MKDLQLKCFSFWWYLCSAFVTGAHGFACCDLQISFAELVEAIGPVAETILATSLL